MFSSGIQTAAARGRCYAISGQALAVTDTNPPAIPEGAVDAAWLYLGDLAGAPCFARELAAPEDAPAGTALVPLRALYGALPDADFAIALRALGLVAWARDHQFCGRCGTPTDRSPAERACTCPRCALAVYPRISPAVIVRVEKADRILLARNARNPMRFHSVLAGFVEVGESLEETVAREIGEEVGIAIADVRYFGSQPWPFTNSLMIAFTARWASGELAPDGTEIVEAAWYPPDALPPVPPPLSIARRMIDDFCARVRA